MKTMTVKQLFDGPVREYSIYANVRAIPDMVDGMKPSQRKALYAAHKKDSSVGPDGIKVAQLASYAAEVTAYHHGEGSLEGTIVKLAQDFSGSNNVNFLLPLGQFGSKLSPAAGAGRYIFTKLSPSFRRVFRPSDDKILEHIIDDGDEIEPVRYLPIVPTILINGSEGMGTGHACSILQHDPSAVRDAVLARLRGKPHKRLVPSWRSHTGTVKMTDVGQVIVTGKFTRVNTTTIVIDELPVWVYQDDFKETLNDLEDKKFIHSFDNESTADGFKFVVRLPRTSSALSDEVLLNKFKLVARFTQNFTVWLPNGKIKKFQSADDLIDAFVEYRLSMYEIRRLREIEEIKRTIEVNEERMRFIRLYLVDPHQFSRMTKAQVIDMLNTATPPFKSPDSHVSIPIYSLTIDNVEKLAADIASAKSQIERLEGLDAKTMWTAELETLKL